MPRLAILAGRGVLPKLLFDAHPNSLVVSFQGVGLDFDPANRFDARFEKIGALFKTLRRQGVEEVCFAGAITRPNLKLWRMDFATIRMLPRIKAAINDSDGNALRIIRDLVEEAGFSVIGAHELCPKLLAEEDVLGAFSPMRKDADSDIEIARQKHVQMSKSDSGQALVIRRETCIAEEGLAGTKAMLADVSSVIPAKGYLYKASKIDQDLTMDMASIGPDTIDQIVVVGLEGIYVGAGRTLLLERDKLIERANAAGVFIIGVA